MVDNTFLDRYLSFVNSPVPAKRNPAAQYNFVEVDRCLWGAPSKLEITWRWIGGKPGVAN